ncbi:hypothetical protein SY85_12800 [Flavisolibacter tropicus]|uniref:IPExxxVDY family protein n=2 Tax=Flavisolibacter tropicus TaxID=1492898 RepID=A0A172TWZ6_9BACT|nr:hypothetical protein SY85_12800 [Flavisolibacter tropicus]
MSVLDKQTEVNYIIPQRGVDEDEIFNVWDMQKPGFHVVKRLITIKEHSFYFTHQSIWLESYFKDPDDKEFLFKFIASNDHKTNSLCVVSILEGERLLLPELRFSIENFDLDAIFNLKRAIVELYQIKTLSGKEYTLQLHNA